MRYAILTALVLALPSQSAFARGHFHHSHSATSEHHHVHHGRGFAYRHRHHHRYAVRRHHRSYAAAPPQEFGSPFAVPFQFGFGQQAPQQRVTRYSRRHGFGSYSVASRSSALDGIIAQQASANGVPLSLVHRVIKRESGYNPRAVSRGNYGLMQIRLGTARAMGYGGSAGGLLDANTNMTYAVRYLAGAYRAAGGNESRAVALYASGYRTARARRRPAMAQANYSSYPFGATPRGARLISVAYLNSAGSGGNGFYRARRHRHHSY